MGTKKSDPLEDEDYKLVANTLKVLQNQLTQSENDLSTLLELRSEAMADPLAFVERLTTKNSLNPL
ncbi:hypothetical protein HK096_002421, partial [Nowakowskiella sp. JEL0078]